MPSSRFRLRQAHHPKAVLRTRFGQLGGRVPELPTIRGVLDEIAVWTKPLIHEEMPALFTLSWAGRSYCSALTGRSSPPDREHSVTSKSATPSVLRLAAPLVVSFWMRAAFTFVDTAYAATLGDAAVAAIGLAVPFEFLMIAIWMGLSTGLTSAMSRAISSGQGAKIEQYKSVARKLIGLAIPLFMLIGAGVWFGAKFAGLEPKVEAAFQIYGTVLLGGSAFTAFWSVIPDSVVKAHHDTKATMWAGIISNLINVVLNTFFLFVLKWGIFGIALSTVIGRIGGLAYALRRADEHEQKRIAEQAEGSIELDPQPLWAILKLAIPSALTFGLMAMQGALINGFLATFQDSTAAIAAYSIYHRCSLFFFNPIIALAIALLPFTASMWGKQDMAGVRRGFGEASGAALLYILVFVSPIMWFLSPWLAEALSEAELTARYATVILRAVPLACLSGCFFLLSRPIFEGMGRGSPGFIVALLRFLFFIPPGVWIGVKIARDNAQPELYGLVGGLVAVSTLSSLVFLAWLGKVLLGTPTFSEDGA